MSIAPPYCTREAVKGALDVKTSADLDWMVDESIRAASTAVYRQLHRYFHPSIETLYFDWPNYQYARPWVLWLDDRELLALPTAVTSGGITIAVSNLFVEPNRTGPPYNRLELNIGTSTAFSGGATPQRSIAITGLWGYNLDTTPAGLLAAAITDTTGTTVDVTDCGKVGVWSLLSVDSERMLVTDKTMLTTAQVLGAPGMAASLPVVTVPVTTGSAYAVGETILIDAEKMRITDVAGNNLIVKRAWDGSVLAAHTAGATIYAPRRCTVVRGAYGTTAATHLVSAPLAAHDYPPMVRELAQAEAINAILQKTAGYTRTVGAGDNVRNASGAGLADLRARAMVAHGRQARYRVV